MKQLLKIAKYTLPIIGILACMLVASSVVALADDSENPVMRRSYPGETHKGMCCKSWEASVTINEPVRNVPIVVTFSMDYRANAPFYVGARLNDGPCVFNGPSTIPAYEPEVWSRTTTTFQWVFMPGDYKLAKGLNVITVCGGGVYSLNDTIELGYYTLSARLQTN
ncbi:MAG TPA: hypothetical protein VN577_12840 [Terriglobales bacterium]|nr:hypothetical protein [Terriglobales bacterium]